VSLEKRVETLERELGAGEVAHVYVVWSDEEAEAVELAPGESLSVVTWLSDDSIEVEERGCEEPF
jgi:hypothetical protein